MVRGSGFRTCVKEAAGGCRPPVYQREHRDDAPPIPSQLRHSPRSHARSPLRASGTVEKRVSEEARTGSKAAELTGSRGRVARTTG